MKRQDYDHTKLTGMAADLETSLKEYGLAWIETDTEYLFYYGIDTDENECDDMDYSRFDFRVMDKGLNVKEEYDWIEDWDGINSYAGIYITGERLQYAIHALLDYYGHENIFGSSYYEGLTYDEIVPKD